MKELTSPDPQEIDPNDMSTMELMEHVSDMQDVPSVPQGRQEQQSPLEGNTIYSDSIKILRERLLRGNNEQDLGVEPTAADREINLKINNLVRGALENLEAAERLTQESILERMKRIRGDGTTSGDAAK